MTTIDTALDASINANDLAGSSTEASLLADAAALSPAITADYYNLTESDGWPIAGLVVLLDRHHRPVRAEVHLYDNTMGRRQDDALNNANNLLIQRYRSLTEEASKLPLRVMRTRQELDTLQVQLDVDAAPAAAQPATARAFDWRTAKTGITAATAVVIAALLVTIAVLFQRNAAPLGNSAAENPVPATVAEAPGNALPAYGDELRNLIVAPRQGPTVVVAEAPGGTAADAAKAEPALLSAEAPAPVVADYVNPYPLQTNDLPTSTVAHAFAVQDRAQVAVGHLAVQSEPDPDPTFSVAWKEQGTIVQLIGGPVWKAGDTDTIVWWYVRTGDNEEGWMASNGSTLRFLVPLP